MFSQRMVDSETCEGAVVTTLEPRWLYRYQRMSELSQNDLPVALPDTMTVTLWFWTSLHISSCFAQNGDLPSTALLNKAGSVWVRFSSWASLAFWVGVTIIIGYFINYVFDVHFNLGG